MLQKSLAGGDCAVALHFSVAINLIPHCNALPQHVVDAPSVNSFKQRLDRMLLHKPSDMDI
jgi:hypothetical protein